MSQPGSSQMPEWDRGELPVPPTFAWRNCFAMLGPGLFMAGAAIGGGEWLTGPVITARYGGSLLWLATLSILGQVVYNVEVSRYTLYTGEPIFAGKFRTRPGPKFWLVVYLVFDVYMFFPFLASAGATPLVAMFRGEIPNPSTNPSDLQLVRGVSIGLFLLAMVPLIVGGKIYNSIKVLMSAKIILIMGFLVVLACMFATPKNWIEVGSGFLKFGNVPIRRHEDANQNGVLDPGEDWDGDGRLDVKEPTLRLTFDTDGDGLKDATDVNEDGKADTMVSVQRGEKTVRWPDLDGDGTPDKSVAIDTDNDGNGDVIIPLDKDGDGKLDSFADVDGDGVRDGGNVANVLVALFRGQPFPVMDWSMVAFLCALVAISGNGGLGNSAISNYTREQGWGMGAHVGAIPSIVGGRDLKLSHVGMVFEPTIESLKQWRRWFWHVARDQWAVWMPGCFIGVALPAMMSLMFLPRGFYLEDQWQTAVFTANGLRDSVGGTWGSTFWMMTLFCAFLVLATGVTPAADGFLRRWVDVIWIASPRARRLDPRSIRYVYFGVLAIYSTFGVFMLTQESPTTLLFISAMISNFALGFSCLHTLAVNMTMLPRELRPGWFCRTALFLAGSFFLFVATIATYTTLKSRGII